MIERLSRILRTRKLANFGQPTKSTAGQLERGDIDRVHQRVLAGTAEREEVLRAVDQLLAAGSLVPLPIERRSLEIHIGDDPSRIDLKRRLVQVHRLQGEPIPQDLLDEVNASYVEDEKAVDYQQALKTFSDDVDYRDMEAEFFTVFEAVRPYSMTTIERLYSLWESVRYAISRDLDGDFVETGVWRGGCCMLMAHELVKAGHTDRTLWLYDTFEGLPKPDAERDIDVLGNRAIDGWEPRQSGDDRSLWAYGPLCDVKANLATTGYPEERQRYVVGKVEETIPAEAPERIAVLRIDTDWYESYAHILIHLYDRVVPGGIVIFDDYGHFLGARQAVDEFLSARGLAVPMIRIDYSSRIIIKT